MGIKDEYVKKLQTQLDKITLEVKQLKLKADKAKSDVKIQYHKQLEDIREKQAVVEKKLHEISNASDEALKELKTGMEASWKTLVDSVKSASKKFNK